MTRKRKYYYIVKIKDEVLVVDAKNKEDALKKAFKHFWNVRYSNTYVKRVNPKDFK